VDEPRTARPATCPTEPSNQPSTPAPPRSLATAESRLVAVAVTTALPIADDASGLTPRIVIPPGSHRNPTGPAGPVVAAHVETESNV
jgi:hypothetical protein